MVVSHNQQKKRATETSKQLNSELNQIHTCSINMKMQTTSVKKLEEWLMMMPSVFGESLFDDLMDFPFEKEFFGRRNPLYGKHADHIMKTDIKELDAAYEMDIDLPGFKKEDVSAKLENGYLTISAVKGVDKDEKNDKGVYIRRERYAGQCARTFYVGEDVKQEDIKARFEDGILKVTIPKIEHQAVEAKKYIAIEG